jgi:VWFA-related protein
MTFQAAARTALALAAIPVTGAMAQGPEPRSTLRVEAQLVEVGVVVRDSHGNPVTDLKQGDFELYDKGQKQEIRVFHVEDYSRAGSGAQPAATAAPAGQASPGLEFSNRPQAEPGAPNAPTVIVIDVGGTWDHTRMTWPALVYARDQLIRFLRHVHPEDRLGIYLMGADRFWILHEYNQTCADLLDRLATWKAAPGPGSTSAKSPDVWSEFAGHFANFDAATLQAIHHSQFYTYTAAGSPALPDGMEEAPGASASTPHGTLLAPELIQPIALLGAVAHHLASVPGRKNVILISGKAFLPGEFKAQVSALRTIIQAGVTVYPVDPGGLAPYALDASFAIPSVVTAKATTSAGAHRAAEDYIRKSGDWKRELTMRLQTSLGALAAATGGKAFLNSNDTMGAIRSALEDSRITYTLGFYPESSHNDGSFHAIRVKVRGRDLEVHSRAGYFEPEPPQRDPHRLEAESRVALLSPVDASGIELSGGVSSGTEPDGYELKLNIGLAGIGLQSAGGRWSGQIQVMMFARDGAGAASESLSQTVGLNLQQDTYDKALASGLQFSHGFKLDSKASSLRVIVRDLNSGNLGTLTIPLPASAWQ